MSVLAYPIQSDTHWPRWYAFHLISAGILGYHYAKKYHLSLGLLISVVFWSGANAFSGRFKYESLHEIAQLDLSNMSAKATLAFFVLVFIGDILDKRHLISLLHAYLYVCVVHSILALVQLFILKIPIEECVGFFPNVSMGPNMLAVLLPILVMMLFERRTWPITVLVLILNLIFVLNIYLFRSSMGWGTAMVGFVSIAFLRFKDHLSWRITTVICSSFAICLYYVGRFFDGSWTNFTKIDRFIMWPLFMNWWVDNSDHFIGAGTGTFRQLGPSIQLQNKLLDHGIWLWMHSDILQVLFEIGFIGLILALWLVMVCLIKLYRSKNHQVMVVFLAYIAMCLGNYPLRLAEYAFLGMILIAFSLKVDDGICSESKY